MIIQPVRDALDYYRRLNEATQPPRHRKSTDVTGMHAVNPAPSSTTGTSSCSDNVCDKAPSASSDNATTNTAAKMPRGSVSDEVDDDATAPLSPLAKSPPVSSPDGLVATGTGSPPEQATVDPLMPPMGHRHSNPLSYRRASQLLMLKASGSSNSLKVSGLQPLRNSSGANNSQFQSFPSVESESDKEGDEAEDYCCGTDEEAITEVAVSEKALKFKIATEPSFDFSTSRKGSRENKSESSGQSTVATKDDRISFDTSFASTPKVEFVPSSVTLGAALSSPGKHVSSSKATSSSASSSSTKGKPKDSFFSRLKLFTERLSISDSTTSGGSGCESPPGSGGYKHHSIHYFRRVGRKDSKRNKSKEAVGGSERYHRKHRGSSSDPEGHGISDDKLSIEGKENLRGISGGGSEVVSPECSPALSGASGTEHRRSSWKHCSGSLDSVLSKDEHAKRSPSRRLMLPRFSSFVQKKTRMGFMMRRSSPKGSSTNTNEPPS